MVNGYLAEFIGQLCLYLSDAFIVYLEGVKRPKILDYLVFVQLGGGDSATHLVGNEYALFPPNKGLNAPDALD